MKGEIYLLDDPQSGCAISSQLERDDFIVRVFHTAYDLVCEAAAEPPSLFLLDAVPPDGDVYELCRRIRRSPTLGRVPLIILTARNGEGSRVNDLNAEADDYIAKPFSPGELVARVRAVLRRSEHRIPPGTVEFGNVEIRCESMRLLVRGQLIPTTATEFRLLEFFVRHPGRVHTRHHLLAAVRRDNTPVTPRMVDVYVRLLRRKIEPSPENPTYLKTVRGAGYIFEVEALQAKSSH